MLAGSQRMGRGLFFRCCSRFTDWLCCSRSYDRHYKQEYAFHLPHFSESTSPSTDLSTLLPSCGPFDTVTSRSERQDHFGSDFVVIWAAMSFASLRLRPFEVGCGCSHDQNSPRISKKTMSSLGSNIASLGLTIFVGFHQRSVH